jgi:hypothetical protein
MCWELVIDVFKTDYYVYLPELMSKLCYVRSSVSGNEL